MVFGEALFKRINGMKNKTIEILVDGRHRMPTGAKFTMHHTSGKKDETIVKEHTIYSLCVGDSSVVYEVDFSDLPPLYPAKGMTVPADGIEFADGKGKLLLVGEHGIAYAVGANDYIFKWDRFSEKSNGLHLKRELPKTKTVCAECFKEVCECKHEMGYYPVEKDGLLGVCYYDGRKLHVLICHIISRLEVCDCDVNWNNPINVTPESEVKS